MRFIFRVGTNFRRIQWWDKAVTVLLVQLRRFVIMVEVTTAGNVESKNERPKNSPPQTALSQQEANITVLSVSEEEIESHLQAERNVAQTRSLLDQLEAERDLAKKNFDRSTSLIGRP